MGIVEPEKVVESLELNQLMRIANDVGKDWKMLSRYLGLNDITIQTISKQSDGDIAEASLNALLK